MCCHAVVHLRGNNRTKPRAEGNAQRRGVSPLAFCGLERLTAARIGGTVNKRAPIFAASVLFLLSVSVSKSQDSQKPALKLKVDVDLVLVNVTVTDSHNRFVQGLSKEDFLVWEDKVEQEVRSFERADTPVSLGIVLDRSASMGGKKPKAAGQQALEAIAQTRLEQARSSAYACLQKGLREDEYFLIEFSDAVQLTADITRDVSKLRDKLVFLGAGGRTALWDAIYAGVAKLQETTYARKALLVLTDGDENHSRYSLSQLKGALRERDVRIYTMNQPDVQIDGLKQLVNASGGMVFNSNKPCDEFSAELHNQYVLGYRTTNRSTNGAWHAIKVGVKTSNLPKDLSKVSVRARSGYFSTQE